MSRKSNRAVGVVIIFGMLILALGFALLWPGGDEDVSLESRARPSSVGDGSAADMGTAGPDGADRLPDRIEIGSGRKEAETGIRKGIRFAGRVVDRETREPVTVFHVELFRLGARYERTDLVDEVVRDRKGGFSFALEKSGPVHCNVTSSRHCTTGTSVDVPFHGTEDLLIELDAGARVTGLVIEDATGDPVPGALVGFGQYTRMASIRRGEAERTPHTRTDGSGRFRLSGLPDDQAILPTAIAAVHPAFAEGYTYTIPSHGKDLVIRLKKGFYVHGRVRDDGGEPLPGAWIFLSGKTVPLTLACRTGEDGRYRTGQAEPGTVDVKAETRSDDGEDRFDFTPEIKRVVLAKRNVEVNFGPSPGHVTYKGIVVDHDGSPLAGVGLSLALQKNSGPPLSTRAKGGTVSTGAGRFEVRKLVPGSYSVHLSFPGQRSGFEWGIENFETPGTYEREFRLAELGGTISGIVVDKATGFSPLQDGSSLSVAAYCQEGPKHFQCHVNREDGSFCLRGLTPGKYYLNASGSDCFSEGFEVLDIEKGEILSAIRLEVSFAGTFHLVLNGFGDADVNDLSARITGMNRWSVEVPHIEKREHRMPLTPGEFEIRVEKPGLGSLVRPFTIEASRVTHMVIDRSEMITPSGDFTIRGRVTFPDGRPASGIALSFSLKSGAGGLETVADSRGRYASKGIEPGRWTVRGDFRESERCLTFADLIVPAHFGDPLIHDLVVPAGAVRGTICSSLTRLPVEGGDLGWRAWLVRPDQYFALTAAQADRTAGRFELIGVRSGRYQLAIEADGYGDYLSEAFDLAAEEQIDVGNVFLDPMGILDLEVVDGQGKHVDAFRVYPADEEEQIGRDGRVREGVFRYEGLPVGPFRFRVEARKHGSRETTIDLLPATPVEVRIVLERS